MKLKQIFTLVFGIICIAGLTWYTIDIINSEKKSPRELIDFAVADTSAITMIRITDPNSVSIELKKRNKRWTDANGACITQGMVHNILDVSKNIAFKGYLPQNSHQTYKNLMSTSHTKVEYYVKNKWYKTWYIGPPSPDHYGQIMLLDSKEFGKSSEPVMMEIKGVHGIIAPNFFADYRQWMCTNIFAVPMEKLIEVNIINHDDSTSSFKIKKEGTSFNVSQFNQKLPYVDTANLYRYIHNYKKIHYDGANYELSEAQCDSLKKTQPFAELILKEGNNIKQKTTHLKMFRIKSEDTQRNEFGELVNMDMNKFWCELGDGSLVKCQYHVFNPLLFGYVYFPALDKTRKLRKNT